MHTLYLLSVWLHILAATIWIGGMFFLVLVVVPWMRAGGRQAGATFLRETGLRFRRVGWWCFGIVVVTGTFNLWVRGVRLADFVNIKWLSSTFGGLILLKLAVFALVLFVSLLHDFILGPRATDQIARDPGSPEAALARKRASLLGRLNVVFGLVLLALGVAIVRGLP